MFQISLPSWGALDDQEVMLFFKTVCNSFPDCRFLHYNLPRAKHIINGTQYRRIIDEVPNLVATKNSTTDYARTADLMLQAPELQHFFLEGSFAMGCTLGECSLLCSYDALFPKTTWQFYQAGLDRNLEELFRITDLFNQAGEALFAHCSRQMIDGSYDKTFLWLTDPQFSNRMLPPYLGLTEQESQQCKKVLESQLQNIR
jgi:dihydrodipicolinate synthase/N-acetylneuraminate lyase